VRSIGPETCHKPSSFLDSGQGGAYPEGMESNDAFHERIQRERQLGGYSGYSVSVQFKKLNCRVGKGRPSGSIEFRVSPSPSKIPYGGFSPVRLQMDRQWRPSTKSRGLSAVHIRPTSPT